MPAVSRNAATAAVSSARDVRSGFRQRPASAMTSPPAAAPMPVMTAATTSPAQPMAVYCSANAIPAVEVRKTPANSRGIGSMSSEKRYASAVPPMARPTSPAVISSAASKP